MKIKKNDQVLIKTGKDKGRKGKVLKVLFEDRKLVIEGINLKKKHVKPKKSGEKGQVVELPAPIDISNVKILCNKCGAAVKIGYEIKENKKYRICKKCKQEM